MNGVPLRRVNQSYVIATSTKVDLEGVALPEIDDAYFAKEKVASKKSKEDKFFAQSAEVRCRSAFNRLAWSWKRPLVTGGFDLELVQPDGQLQRDPP